MIHKNSIFIIGLACTIFHLSAMLSPLEKTFNGVKDTLATTPDLEALFNSSQQDFKISKEREWPTIFEQIKATTYLVYWIAWNKE
jgi:hypothetical protein